MDRHRISACYCRLVSTRALQVDRNRSHSGEATNLYSMGAYEKQLALVESDIQSGEHLITSLKGVDGSLTGAMVVTNQRFVFYGSNGLKKERRAYPWAQVTSVEHEINRMSVDYLLVSTSSGRQKYLVARGDGTKVFADAALSALASARTGSGSADVTDQLAKLAELRDAGILTEEEFASKKAELLRRI